MAATFKFDGRNESAVRVAERQAAMMVTRISDETRAAIRGIIARSIREGISPYDAARMIRETIGLSAPQAQAAANYRASLVKRGMPFDQITKLLEKYTKKQIAARAKVIARTEIMDALGEGALEGWRQAREQGFLGPNAEKVWITTPDEKTCLICAPMNGVRVKLDEPFQTLNGEFMMPPAHPNCRCSATALAGKIPSAPKIPTSVDEFFGDDAVEMFGIMSELEKNYNLITKLPSVGVVDPAIVRTGLHEVRAGLDKIGRVNMHGANISWEISQNLGSYIRTAQTEVKINAGHAVWAADDRVLRMIIRDAAAGLHPAAGRGALIVHEIGHVLQKQTALGRSVRAGLFKFGPNGRETWALAKIVGVGWESINDFMIKYKIVDPLTEFAIIAGQVSRYAQRNATEFVADVYQGLIYGGRYSQEVLDLYAALGGPKIARF